MTIKRDLVPRRGVSFTLLEGRPVYRIELRVDPNLLSDFLDYDSQWFLDVDKETREVLRFVHQTGTHFNLLYLYRYASWEQFLAFDEIYRAAWMAEYSISDPDEAQLDIEAKEAHLNEMIEDSARHLLIEVDGNTWRSPAEG